MDHLLVGVAGVVGVVEVVGVVGVIAVAAVVVVVMGAVSVLGTAKYQRYSAIKDRASTGGHIIATNKDIPKPSRILIQN